jgi:excisionase family DNA binding protein
MPDEVIRLRGTPKPKVKMPITEIMARLGIGRMAVYKLLEAGIIPAIRLGRQWIVTRPAFDQWERTCGSIKPPALPLLANVVH